MKLIIKRDQKQDKALFGGDKCIKFLLSCRTEGGTGDGCTSSIIWYLFITFCKGANRR